MPGPLALEHVNVRVDDLSTAVDFYGDVLGLVEIAREDGTVYFGCGRDETFDLAIAEGRPGLDHFAIRVADPDAIEARTADLENAGVAVERRDGTEPGQERGVRFVLPGGVPMELVAVEHTGYPHDDDVAFPDRSDRAPIALDHVNVSSPRIRADVEFLTDVTGLRLSEVVGADDDWDLAFARCGERHHDVALGSTAATDPPGFHHVGWEYRGIDHMKRAIDAITRAGVDLERGLGRHYAGNNLYAYVVSPGGNRLEILAEMARVHTTEVSHVEEYDRASVAWGAEAPDSFGQTSAVVGDGRTDAE